ncbi:MAG: hypothetical protein KA778_00520 [Burkholderiaceae bacterium]|nr:hypothetical protein [Burkholderiaceae bacterium]
MAKLDVARMSTAARESLQARELPDEVDRERLTDYLGGLCAAIGGALARWQSQAILRDVRVEGARASGGRVVGPEVEGLIRGAAPVGWPEYTHPLSSGIRDQVRRFERELRVPNLVWYPALAHVFAAQAAPTLNLPSPLAALAVKARVHLTGPEIYAAMHAQVTQQAGRELPSGIESLMAALCEGFDEVIPAWLDATLVTQVVATGPVPSFAPPEVPGGPVVGGSAAMLRGGGFF